MQSLQQRLKDLIVNELNLEDVSASDIDVNEPLFGARLGLDSIDALELAMAVHREFGVRIDADDAEHRAAMSTVAKLADYIAERQPDVSTT